jgi:hypothetical protein
VAKRPVIRESYRRPASYRRDASRWARRGKKPKASGRARPPLPRVPNDEEPPRGDRKQRLPGQASDRREARGRTAPRGGATAEPSVSYGTALQGRFRVSAHMRRPSTAAADAAPNRVDKVASITTVAHSPAPAKGPGNRIEAACSWKSARRRRPLPRWL